MFETMIMMSKLTWCNWGW